MKNYLLFLAVCFVSLTADAQTTDYEVSVHQDIKLSCKNELLISHGKKLTNSMDLVVNKIVQESYCTLSCTGGKSLSLKMGDVIKFSNHSLDFDGILKNNYQHFPVYLSNSPYTLWINCHTGAGVALLELGQFDIGNVNSQLKGYLNLKRSYTLGSQSDSNRKEFVDSKMKNIPSSKENKNQTVK